MQDYLGTYTIFMQEIAMTTKKKVLYEFNNVSGYNIVDAARQLYNILKRNRPKTTTITFVGGMSKDFEKFYLSEINDIINN